MDKENLKEVKAQLERIQFETKCIRHNQKEINECVKKIKDIINNK